MDREEIENATIKCTPVQPAPRRQRRLAVVWRNVKRFVLGACCIRAAY